MGATGVLYASCCRPNPSGSGADALFLFQGTPAAAPVRAIVAAAGVTLPLPPDFAPDRPFRLRLLHFNDLHGRLADVSEHASTPVFARPGRAHQTGAGGLRPPSGQWAAGLCGRR